MKYYLAEKYAEDVMSGKILTCELTKLAIKRHLDDLDKIGKKNFPYFFDEEAAKHRLDFYQFCRHSKGEWAGQVFIPAPWQQFIDWVFYGWKRKDGSRRFRTSYVECARKSGKSTQMAADGLYQLAFDGEPGSEVFTAATKLRQALIIHSESTRMVKKSPALRRMLGITKDRIYHEESGSFYIPLGEDAKTEDGWNVQAAMIDEYHAHPNSGIFDVLRSAMGSRRQPVIKIITTAGYERSCPCYKEREYAINVLREIFKDESYFAIIYTLDDGDEWQDEKVWIKSNPNLGISVKMDDMKEMCHKALNSPSFQNEFLTKKLNIWTNAVTVWIKTGAWEACNMPVDADALSGNTCYGAFDLSTTTDITAWVLCFPPDNGGEYHFLFRFFMPQDDLEERIADKNLLANLRLWIKQGFIQTTPGNVIDYDFIYAQIEQDSNTYDLFRIAYDPWNATQIVNDLQKDDFDLVEYRQTYANLSPAAKDFEQKILGKQIAHGGNPVMNWMISCTEVAQDSNGNIKPVKPDRQKSSKRIDGVVASIMALDMAVRESEGSAYDNNGKVFVA